MATRGSDAASTTTSANLSSLMGRILPPRIPGAFERVSAGSIGRRVSVKVPDHTRKPLGDDPAPNLERRRQLPGLGTQFPVEQVEALDLLEGSQARVLAIHFGLVERPHLRSGEQ